MTRMYQSRPKRLNLPLSPPTNNTNTHITMYNEHILLHILNLSISPPTNNTNTKSTMYNVHISNLSLSPTNNTNTAPLFVGEHHLFACNTVTIGAK